MWCQGGCGGGAYVMCCVLNGNFIFNRMEIIFTLFLAWKRMEKVYLLQFMEKSPCKELKLKVGVRIS